MNLDFFADPGLAPKPREEIRIESFELTPYPDRRRVRVELEVTPFAPIDRPNLEIVAHKPDSTQVASATIIEAVQRHVVVTLHLRGAEPPEGEIIFQVSLYYGEEPPQHSVTRTIDLSDIPASDESDS